MAQISDIVKLTAENYSTWELLMRSYLITKGLWTIKDCALDFKDESLRKEWEDKDKMALNFIRCGVSLSELQHIEDCKTAREAWQILADLHCKAKPSVQILLMRRLLQFKIANDDDHMSKINEFLGIRADIVESGLEIPENLYTILLLCALSKKFESFVAAFERRDELPTFSELKTKIYEEVLRKKLCEALVNNKLHTTEAQHSKNAERNTGRKEIKVKQNKKKSIKCFKCGKIGHYQSQCKGVNRGSVNVFVCEEK